ncbi:MAG TPA: UvrD-helicase domain-containing protein [Polyangiaceae bacterium]
MVDVSNENPVFAFRRNLVLAASAGTGKTHALVGVIVHLVMGATATGTPVEPRRIVATTFSRKAAAEMRERLTTELERLALGDPRSAYREGLLAASLLDEKSLRHRAHHVLARAGEATIGTLHSFATRLLREYALEAGVPPAFELLDETETRARAERSICAILAEEAEHDGDAVRDLVQVAGGVVEAARQLARAIGRLDEDGRPAGDLFLDETDATTLDETMRSIRRLARALSTDSKFEVGARMLLALPENTADFDALAEAIGTMCEARKSAKDSDDARAFFLIRDEELGGGSLPNRQKGAAFVKTWALRQRFMARGSSYRKWIERCDERVRADRVREGALAFSDVLRMTRDLLLARPDVCAQIADRLDALLVDEFQDTSRVQRDIVAMLWQKDAAARKPGVLPALDEVRDSGLLVVGDRKQSIYGFRGASVAVFAESCVLLAGEAARSALAIDASSVRVPDHPTADFVALRHNRRGVGPLLAFANAFSAARLTGTGKELDEIRYAPATEDLLLPPERAAGAGAIDEPRIFWLRPEIEKGAATKRLDEAFAVAERIETILETGAPRVANGAAPSPRDIAVLSSTNDMLDAVAFALAERKIPYVVAGRGFFSAREVKDVIAVLRVLVSKEDTIALAEVLRGPWCGLADESLFALADGPRGLDSLDTVAKRADVPGVSERDRDRIRAVVALLTRLRDDVDRVAAGDLLAEAVRLLAFEETLVQLPRGEQRVANVRKLVDIARAFEGSAHLLAARFADAVDQASGETEAATFSDEDDAVRLLTVHASKGLAFPIVFVPEVARGGKRPDFPAMLVDVGAGKERSSLSVRVAAEDGSRVRAPSYGRACDRMKFRERAELHRLAYVAVTRAAHALYFVGDRTPPKSGSAEAFEACTAAVLHGLARDDAFRAKVGFVVEDVKTTRGGELAAPAARSIEPAPAPPTPAWSHVAFATTALGDYSVCARRFELAHLLALPEVGLPRFAVAAPPEDDASFETDTPRIDARSEGSIAHRVLEQIPAADFGKPSAEAHVARLLEREGLVEGHSARIAITEKTRRFLGGSYAAKIAREGATIHRETPFVLTLHDDAGRAVSLRGAIDLVVVWPDGNVDVVDYKRARGPDPAAHAFQLDVYALAARDLFPEAKETRAGILFLGGDPSEPKWHPLEDAVEARARIAKLGDKVVRSRWAGLYVRAPIAVCKKIHCGYVGLCHPKEDAKAAQLALF